MSFWAPTVLNVLICYRIECYFRGEDFHEFCELNAIHENFHLENVHSICALFRSNIRFAEVISEETCLLEIGM